MVRIVLTTSLALTFGLFEAAASDAQLPTKRGTSRWPRRQHSAALRQ